MDCRHAKPAPTYAPSTRLKWKKSGLAVTQWTGAARLLDPLHEPRRPVTDGVHVIPDRALSIDEWDAAGRQPHRAVRVVGINGDFGSHFAHLAGSLDHGKTKIAEARFLFECQVAGRPGNRHWQPRLIQSGVSRWAVPAAVADILVVLHVVNRFPESESRRVIHAQGPWQPSQIPGRTSRMSIVPTNAAVASDCGTTSSRRMRTPSTTSVSCSR